MIHKALTGSVSICLLAGMAAAQDSDLTILDYAGFELPEYHPAYVAAHGDSPSYSFFSDEEDAFQKVVSGFDADMSQICAGSVTKWVESGILEPWDIDRIPAYADLDAALTGRDVTEGIDNVYFLPHNFGATAIAYNPEEVPEEDVSSLSVFTNPEYAGRMTMPDNTDDAYALAYLATGVTDWSDVTDAEFEAASDWLREVHPNIRTYWADAAELAQLMATGEVLISWAWNETLPTMVAEGRPIAYEREPVEGSSLWLCGYVNLADSGGSEDKAYDFMNAMLDPVTAAPLLDAGYGHANTVGMTDMGLEALEAAGLEPIDGPVLAQLPISIEQRERQAETFEMIKAGF